MTHATHTPGPWGAQHRGYKSAVQPSVSGQYFEVVGADHEANALLIAAAPDLLEAASLAVAAYREGDDDDMDAAIAALNAAITKAKGQP